MRETPFPEAGAAVVIKFTTSDVLHLCKAYGGDPRKPLRTDASGRIIDHFWARLLTGIEAGDPHVCTALLMTGLKEPGPDGKLQPIARDDAWWSDPPFALSDATSPLLDAVMAAHGPRRVSSQSIG